MLSGAGQVGIGIGLGVAPTGVSQVAGGLVFMHGAYKIVEGFRQVVNFVSGTDASSDPKYNTPAGSVTKSETVDHTVDFIAGVPFANTPSTVLNVVNNTSSVVSAVIIINDIVTSSSKSNTSNSDANIEGNKVQDPQPMHPLAPATIERKVESWVNYR